MSHPSSSIPLSHPHVSKGSATKASKMRGPSKKASRSSTRLMKKEEKGCIHASYNQNTPKEDRHTSGKYSHDATDFGELGHNKQDIAGMIFSPTFPSSPPNDPESERAKESERMSGTSRKVSKEENKEEGQPGILKDWRARGPCELPNWMSGPRGTKEGAGRHPNQNREMPSQLVEESQLSEGAKEEGALVAAERDILEKLESGAEGYLV